MHSIGFKLTGRGSIQNIAQNTDPYSMAVDLLCAAHVVTYFLNFDYIFCLCRLFRVLMSIV